MPIISTGKVEGFGGTVSATLTPEQEHMLNTAYGMAKRTEIQNHEQPFTEAQADKLAAIDERFRGIYDDLNDAESNIENPVLGWYYLSNDTRTLWRYDGSDWKDTDIDSAGDMLTMVYDPHGVQADMFDRTNHVGTVPSADVQNLDANYAKIQTLEAKIAQLESYLDKVPLNIHLSLLVTENRDYTVYEDEHWKIVATSISSSQSVRFRLFPKTVRCSVRRVMFHGTNGKTIEQMSNVDVGNYSTFFSASHSNINSYIITQGTTIAGHIGGSKELINVRYDVSRNDSNEVYVMFTISL